MNYDLLICCFSFSVLSFPGSLKKMLQWHYAKKTDDERPNKTLHKMTIKHINQPSENLT
jgi:hypothetical protein